MSLSAAHYPVMLSEMLSVLQPKQGEVYVDGTFGAGGYSRAILEAASCTVIAVDRDPSAQERAKGVLKDYGDRFVFIRGCFGDVEALLKKAGFEKVDGFILDLGVSSMQLDEAARGFSFRFDAPLDMRMDDRDHDLTADEVVNTYEEKDLADLIFQYGEERYARRIAKKIVQKRLEKPIKTTGELAEIVRDSVPSYSSSKIDPATRTFQALRIAVNDELGELERAMDASHRILKPEGRLVVVSFHSLEDRLVKHFVKERSDFRQRGSRYKPDTSETEAPLFTLVQRKALKPSLDEVSENSRSRSARLRWAVRTREQAGGV